MTNQDEAKKKFKKAGYAKRMNSSMMKSYESLQRDIRTLLLAEYMDDSSYPGSLESRISAVRDAARKMTAADAQAAGMEDMPMNCSIDVIATFDDYAYLYDCRGGNYYVAAYSTDASGQASITKLTPAKPELVVAEQLENLREFFRNGLLNADESKIHGFIKIGGDLVEYGPDIYG